MKRRLLGVAVTLLASLSSLLSVADTAYGASSGTCINDTVGCITLNLNLTITNGGKITRSATVWVRRQSNSGIDSAFTLDSTNATNTSYTSGGPVFMTAPSDSTCMAGGNNPQNMYNIAVSDSATGASNGFQYNFCTMPKTGPIGNKVITISLPVQAAGAAATTGGITGSFNVIDLAGNKRDCPAGSPVTITGPTNKTAPIGNGGAFTVTDLAPGTYEVSVNCVINGAAGLIDVKGVVVKAGPPTNIGLHSCDPKANNCGLAGGGATPAPTPKPADVDDTPPPDCDAGAFTWAICPIIHALTDIVDWIRDSIIVPLLKEPPLTQESNQQIYNIWASMRNVASLFFILVFFLVIIGTAAGFDNYTIKKVLPHLVAGAILVPLSWLICAAVIDIGNVLGQGVVTLLSPIIGTPKIDFDTAIGGLFFGAGGIMSIGLAYFAFTTIGLGVLVTVLLAVLSAFVTLVGRKILITLFIILSPFALLAWVLPNTEKWFSRWWRNFLRLIMVYPAFMLFVEAGRLFSATAGATFSAAIPLGGPFHTAVLGMPAFAAIGNVAQKDIAAIVSLAGLWLPVLLFLPFYRKIESEAGAALGKGLDKARNAADSRFGKDSDRAKEAAENRQRNSARRARDYGDKAKNLTGLAKKRAQAMERVNARRAGVPKGFKWNGTNESRELKREAAYSKAQAEHGIVGANALNAEQGLTSETQKDRERAEILMAQTKKRNERASRMGIVKDQDDMGGEHSAAMAANNLKEYEAGVNNSARNVATTRGTLLGQRKAQLTTPQNSRDITEGAIEHGEVKGNAEAAGTAGGILHGANLDNLRLEKENAARAAAGMSAISLQQAHQLRMNDAVKAGISKEGSHLLESEIDVNSTNSKDADLDKEIQARTAKSGGGAITLEQARRLRMGNILKAESSKKRKAGILGEAEQRTYNEVEAAAGGQESAGSLLESGRLLSRQGMVDERQKRTSALDAQARGQVPTTNTLLRASRDTQGRAFAKASQDQQSIVNDLDNDIVAEQGRVARASIAAKTFLSPAQVQAQANANVRNRRIDNAGTSALTKGERAASASVNTEAGIVDDLDNDVNDEIIDIQRAAKLASGGTPLPANVALARAQANVRAKRLNNSGTTARTKASRSSADEIGAEAGVKREVDSTLEDAAYDDIQKAAIAAGGALPENIARSRAQAIVAARAGAAGDDARAKAVRDVNRRELGNIRNTSEGNAASASRTQVTDAEGSQNSARTQINEQADKIFAAGGVSKADAQAQAKAIVTRKNLNTAGNAARLAAEDKGRRTNQGNIGISEGFDKRVNDELNANPSTYSGYTADEATRRATAQVTQRDLDAVGKNAQTAGSNKFTQERSTDVGVAADLNQAVDAEMKRSGSSRDVAERTVLDRSLTNLGDTTREQAGIASREEREKYAGIQDKRKTQIRKEARRAAGKGATQAQIDAQMASATETVDTRNLVNAGVASRRTAGRQALKDTAQKQGIAEAVSKERIDEAQRLRQEDPNLGLSQALAQAEDSALDRNLGALETKAVGAAADQAHSETRDAVGDTKARQAQIDEETDAQGAAIDTEAQQLAGGAGYVVTNAHRQQARDNVRARTAKRIENRVAENSGKAAEIAGQNSRIQAVSKDQAIVTTYDAAIQKAPIEAARNAASNGVLVAARDAAVNQALADGQTAEEAERAGKAAQEDEKTQEAAVAAGETAAKAVAKNVQNGTINKAAQERAAIVAQGVAAGESTMRQESNAAAQVVGLNQAATAPNALNADQRITAQTEAVVSNLARESAATRAAYELTRPGQSLNRSYQATEADATKQERYKILSTRTDEMNKKEFEYEVDEMEEVYEEPELELDPSTGNPIDTGQVDRDGNPIYMPKLGPDGKPVRKAVVNDKDEPITRQVWEKEYNSTTGKMEPKLDSNGKLIPKKKVMRDTIGKTDVNPASIGAMKKRVQELLGDGTRAPQNEDEAIALMVNMSKTNQGRKEVQDIQEKIFGGDYYKNIDPSRLDGHAREVWEQLQDKVPIKTAPYFTIPPAALYDGFSPDDFAQLGYAGKAQYFNYLNDVKQQGLYSEAASNIHSALTNPQVAKNLTYDDYQYMHLFLQDESARDAVAKITGKKAGENGIDILRTVHDKAIEAGVTGKFSAQEAAEYETYATAQNILNHASEGDPNYLKPNWRVGDKKPPKLKNDGSVELDAHNNPVSQVPPNVNHDTLGDFLNTAPTRLVPPMVSKAILDIAGDNPAVATELARAYNDAAPFIGPAPASGPVPNPDQEFKQYIDEQIRTGAKIKPKDATLQAVVQGVIPTPPTPANPLPPAAFKRLKEQFKQAPGGLDLKIVDEVAKLYNDASDPRNPEYVAKINEALLNNTDIPLPTSV